MEAPSTAASGKGTGAHGRGTGTGATATQSPRTPKERGFGILLAFVSTLYNEPKIAIEKNGVTNGAHTDISD